MATALQRQPWVADTPRPPRRLHPVRPATTDPRPDRAEDHAEWDLLLSLCYERYGDNEELGTLRGLRSWAVRLQNGRLVPTIDPTGNDGYATEDEWQAERGARLIPHTEVYRGLLHALMEAR